MARNVYKEEIELIKLPSVAESEKRGRELCGVPFPVLADTDDSKYWKNDRTGLAFKLDSITVELEALDGTLYAAPGLPVAFPHQSDAVGFVIDWRQLVDGGGLLRAGCYKVKVSWTKSSLSGSFYYGSYDLKNYSTDTSEGTARLFVVLNDYVRSEGINYKDSGFATTFRFEGRFGDMQPNYETTNNVLTNRIQEKVKNQANRTYTLKTQFLRSCFTHKIDHEHLLAANRIYISDYNAFNHKEYKDFPVILDEEQSPEYNYPGGSILASVTAYFKDKQLLSESKYDGNIQGSDNIILELPTSASGCAPATVNNSDSTYTASVASGGVLSLPDSQLNVNSVDVGDVISVKTIDVNVTDGTDPVTPDAVSLVGNTLTIEVPSGGGGDGWVRPTDWLAMPAITSADEEIAILHAVWDNDSNYAALRCTTTTGNYQVDWGDGTTTSHASNVVAEHQYDYSTYDTGGATLSSRGYKQSMIRITPLTGGLTTFTTNVRHSTQNQIYATGYLDALLSMPNAIGGASMLFYSSLVYNRYMEQVEILNSGLLSSALQMFSNCTSLQSVPLFDTSSVTNMQYMFDSCISLQSVPLFDTSSVTNMLYMFRFCASLQSVPLFDTSIVIDMFRMFNGCNSLQSVPLFDTSSVTNMRQMFDSCTSLQSVPLFDTSSVTNMQEMFYDCTSLQSVPLFDTSIVINMFRMLSLSQSLQKIPAFNTINVTNMSAFASTCNSHSKTDIICRVSVDFRSNQLSRDGIVNIFNNLIDLTGLTSQNINITNNYGAAALTVPEREIATDKNWTITG